MASSTVEVALELIPAETLHVYYINPGEMGQAVGLTWDEVPEGFTFGKLRFPIPHRVKTGNLPTNGYEKSTHFFSQLTIDPAVMPGLYTFKATASWLACNDEQCLVGSKELEMKLEVVAEDEAAANPSGILKRALHLIPVNASQEWQSSVRKAGGRWLIDLTAPADWRAPAGQLDLFSETSDFFQPGSVPEITRTERGLRISVTASEYSDDLSAAEVVLAGPTPPLRIPLVLTLEK